MVPLSLTLNPYLPLQRATVPIDLCGERGKHICASQERGDEERRLLIKLDVICRGAEGEGNPYIGRFFEHEVGMAH